MFVKGGWKSAVPYFILALLALAFIAPIFKNIENTGKVDWDQFCFFDEVPRKTILEYGQFPLWNPYYSGGRPLHANPQVGFLRPTFWLTTLPFGCVVGLKLETAIMFLLGIIGMLLLCRNMGCSPWASVLGTSIFGFSSYFSLKIAIGFVSFYPLFLLPWLILFFIKSITTPKWLVAASAIIAWGIYSGGAVHVLIPSAILLITMGAFLTIKHKEARPLLFALAIIALGLAFSAFKAVPTFEYLVQHPRDASTNDTTPWEHVPTVFVSREQSTTARHWTPQEAYWSEYGAYVGIIALLFALAGLIRSWRKDLWLAATGALLFLVAVGDFGSFSPWRLLHELPLFSSLHRPSRYYVLTLLVIAIFAAKGFDALLSRARTPYAKATVHLFAMLAIADLFLVGSIALENVFPIPPQPQPPSAHFVQNMDLSMNRVGTLTRMYWNLQANRGTINGYDPIPHVTSAYWPGNPRYRGEVFLQNGLPANYTLWSPNRLVISATSENDTLAIINQNYDRWWYVEEQGFATNAAGLIAARVTPENSRHTLAYRPVSALGGLLTSLLAILGIVALLLRIPYGKQIACVCIVLGAIIAFVTIRYASYGIPMPESAWAPPDIPGTDKFCKYNQTCQSCGHYNDGVVCLNGTCGRDNICLIPLWQLPA
jgi:hypothetical protein